MQYIEQLNNLFNKVKHNVINYDEVFLNNVNYNEHKDAYDYLKMLYIKELWVTETNPSINEGDTEEIIINYIETGDFSNLSKIEKQTIDNIKNAVNKYILYDKHSINNIRIDLIYDIHKVLMKDLLPEEQNGIFRKSYVRPLLKS